MAARCLLYAIPESSARPCPAPAVVAAVPEGRFKSWWITGGSPGCDPGGGPPAGRFLSTVTGTVMKVEPGLLGRVAFLLFPRGPGRRAGSLPFPRLKGRRGLGKPPALANKLLEV